LIQKAIYLKRFICKVDEKVALRIKLNLLHMLIKL